MTTQNLPLNKISLDPDLQPRAALDDELWADYAALIVDGATFPPVTVFQDYLRLWLADGYHRWHAHNCLKLGVISADVRPGTKQDALRFSIQANATHGKPRTEGDYRRAYNLAVAAELVSPADIEAVIALLACSHRWAEKLTKAARDADREARDAEIAALKAAGESNRAVAEKVGVVEKTVRNVTQRSADKTNSAESPHPDPAPQFDAAKVKAGLDYFERPEVIAWHAVIFAFQAVNALQPVDTLFENPQWRSVEAMETELSAARNYLNAFSERFDHDRPS